jgi:hypothetical protein
VAPHQVEERLSHQPGAATELRVFAIDDGNRNAVEGPVVARIQRVREQVERSLREARHGRALRSHGCGKRLEPEGRISRLFARDGLDEAGADDDAAAELVDERLFVARAGEERVHPGNLTADGPAVNGWTIIRRDGTRVSASSSPLSRPPLVLVPGGAATEAAAAITLQVSALRTRAGAAGGAGEAGLVTRAHELFRLRARDGRSWELRPRQVLYLGTHAANDVVVVDPRGALQAQAAWTSPDRAPLLSASRGWRRLLVDGKPLLGVVPLRCGQTIEVGETTLTVEAVSSSAADLIDIPTPEPVDLLCETADADDRLDARQWLAKVLAGLEQARRTGELRVVIDRQTATLRFDRGRVVDASCGDAAGLAALERVRIGAVGAWRFSPRACVRPGPLDLSIREFFELGFWETARRLATHRNNDMPAA